MRHTSLAIAALLLLNSACTDSGEDADDAHPDDTTVDTTAPGDEDPESTIPIDTEPFITGTIEITINETTYRATIQGCELDGPQPDVLAQGTHDDQPIVITHNATTSYRTILSINPPDLLTPGDHNWTTDTVLAPVDGAIDHDAEFINAETGDTTEGTITARCGT